RTLQLTAVAKDATGTPMSGVAIAWASLDTALARVSAVGLVSGTGPGAARVVASAGGKADTSTITIVPLPVASVSVSPTTGSLLVGSTLQLSATPKDSAGTPLAGRTVT